MSEQNPRRTPFYQCHQSANAKIVEFAGWMMPMQYIGIKAEHLAVRRSIGVFDVSHMGRIEVSGQGALDSIQYWLTNDVSKLAINQAIYSPICKPDGGIVDDCLVYCVGSEQYILVINASNREKDYRWFMDHIPAHCKDKVQITHPDQGDRWGLLAIQGPLTRNLLSRLGSISLENVAKNDIVKATLCGIEDCILACTGYTGEDGFEVFVAAEKAVDLWHELMREGERDGITPCGLGARDTLRMEMKYPLYGNDIDDTTNPIEAGLGWTVKIDKGDFIGREVLQNKPTRRLIGFEMDGRVIARHGCAILDQQAQVIGQVTSGGFAPSLERPIGIGYVPAQPQFAKPGSSLLIDIRGKHSAATVVSTPFYRPGQFRP
jgi:aminomethyltransferase